MRARARRVERGASARGDAILTLGVFSSMSGPANVPASSSSSPSFNLAATDPTNQAAPLALATSNTFAPTYQAPTPAPAPVANVPAPTFDAYVNFGTGSFANANSLTTGGPQAWYDSSKIAGLFGGQPTTQQIASFDATVLQRVQQTFALSGVPVTLTDDPNAPAAHTLSVVSNAVNPSLTNAIGMTNIGGNGFHFIDNSAPYAKNVDQLESIVAHNVAHELMLAFGVPEINDQTGHYIDSTTGQLSMFLNPNATFSPGAVKDLLAMNFLQTGQNYQVNEAQMIGGSSPVPEPASLLGWALGGLALAAARRARSRRAPASA